MKSIRLFIEDITNEHIEFCDMYIKKVITNAKRKFYRPKTKIEKYQIVFVGLDTCEDEISYEDSAFEEIFTTYITVNDIPIPVYNPDLAKALLELTEIQRMVVLRNIVLGDRLSDIADEIGVSVQMISKHKIKALEIIKERMTNKR